VRSRRLGHLASYVSARNVSSDLARRIRLYFSAHYNNRTALSDAKTIRSEFADYFQSLPFDLCLELGRELGYLGSKEKGPGLLSQWKSLQASPGR
jgi:hypothetical protein